MPQFNIGSFKIGDNFQPYIIAEIGVNHEGNIDLAKKMIRECFEAGAHAAKFQSYKADKIASKNSPAYWDTEKEKTPSQHALFKKYDGFEEQDYIQLAEYCSDLGIDFMSTPFDLEAVDFLDPLQKAYKIASADITNIPLIRKCAEKGKPLIISTGASTIVEIHDAVKCAKDSGAKYVAILHCVLNYPTPLEHAQLGMIQILKNEFPDLVVGYSDHVPPDSTISALEMAMLSGACILEKHFTFDKTLVGNDHYHAMDKEDLSNFNEKVKKYRLMSSQKCKDLQNEQSAILHARRSIVAKRFLAAGTKITEEDIIAKRPGHGISPIHWDRIIGKAALGDIEEDALLEWSQFE
jgi:sialic acid synthase SpsE